MTGPVPRSLIIRICEDLGVNANEVSSIHIEPDFVEIEYRPSMDRYLERTDRRQVQ